jgi:hypothetical protein
MHKGYFDIMSPDQNIKDSFEAWQETTETGKWAKKNCVKLYWVSQVNSMMASRDVIYFGYMTEKQYTMYLLKFSKNVVQV